MRFESGDAPEWVAARLALTGVPFTVRGPESLARSARTLAGRLAAGAGAGMEAEARAGGPDGDGAGRE